ncbi:MAG: serine protease [Patescibacteria group bacterium]
MAHWFDKIAKGFVITWATLVSFAFPQLDTKQSPVPLLPVPPLETPRATATRTDTSEKTQSDTATTSTETTTTLTHTLPEKEPATESYVPEKIENPADEKSNLEIDRAPVIPQKSWSDINTDSKSAIFNILCTSNFGGVFKPASGTGIIINGDGVVLTAAHVGQFFLLKDYPTKGSVVCTARTGSPAKNEYELELVYLPPEWIEHNLTNITDENPQGTGEYDFAILKIVRRIDRSSKELLPHPFPHLPLISPDKIPQVGTILLQSAYPAGFLGGVITNLSLYNASALTTVNQLFTFGTSTQAVDLFGLEGTILAQKGSSGGAVITDAGKLAGVIVTSTVGTRTDERTLRALTIGHIDRTLFNRSGHHLADILDETNPTAFAKLSYEFNTYVAPQLTAALIKSIEKR